MLNEVNMNLQVTDYINNAPAEQKAIMEILRRLMHDAVKEVQEDFKWSRPIFKCHHEFAYFKTAKSYVTLGFYDSSKLEDLDNLLEGTGKNMRHLKLRTTDDINSDLLKSWFEAASR